MAEQLIKLELIQDNPYQDRENYDDIEALGRTIALQGLQQMPKSRSVNGHFELKFGHRRKRAFEWLAKNWKKEDLPDRYEGYTKMPLEIEEIQDAEMFDGVVVENVHRDDLKVTEKARLLKRYKEVHPDATSEQIGQVFNMSGATVRGMDIFLDLPTEVQAKLDDGTISQGTARTLHSMQRVAPVEKVVATLKEIQKGKELPEDVIESEINYLPNTVEMFDEKHQSGKPRSGHGGWDLDMKKFPNHLLPAMTVEAVGKHEAQLEHLTNPPACTACQFYTKVHGSHFCGLKVCHERKSLAWKMGYLQDASRRTKIAIYAEEDGTFIKLSSWGDTALFEKKHKDLRLVVGRGYQHFKGLDDDMVLVVATGELYLRMKKSSNGGRSVTNKGKRSDKEKAEMQAMKIYRQLRKELMWEFTGVAKSIFDSVPDKVVGQLLRRRNIMMDDAIPEECKHGNAPGEYQRRELVWTLIMEDSSHFRRMGMMTQLKAFEARTGVKPGKGLSKRAEAWDTEINAAAKVQSVAVETPARKGTKKK